MRRHRAEACDRLALADVRPLVEPGAAVTRLQATAERLGASRSALGRALLIEGLERLNTARDCPG